MNISLWPKQIGRKELAPEEAAELWLAEILDGTVAAGDNESWDVYNCSLFPDKTFQVKTATARVRGAEQKKVNGRNLNIREHTLWSWHEHLGDASPADFYILFGILDDEFYTFVLTGAEWREASTRIGTTGGRILSITAQRHSRCGRYTRTYKQNRHWNLYAPSIESIRRRIGEARTHQPLLAISHVA